MLGSYVRQHRHLANLTQISRLQPNGFCFEPFAEPTQPCMFEASYDVRNRVDPCHTTSAFACIWLPFVQDVGPKRQPTAIACLRTHLQTQCLNYDVVGLIFVCGALCVRQGPLHLDAFACVCPASLRAGCGSARSPYVPSTPSRHVNICSRCWGSVRGWKSGHLLCFAVDVNTESLHALLPTSVQKQP